MQATGHHLEHFKASPKLVKPQAVPICQPNHFLHQKHSNFWFSTGALSANGQNGNTKSWDSKVGKVNSKSIKRKQISLLTEKLAKTRQQGQKANNYMCIPAFTKSTVQMKEYLLTLRNCSFLGVIMAFVFMFSKKSSYCLEINSKIFIT